MTDKTMNLSWVRKQFPALQNNMIFMDNAGGSQTLGAVMHKITEYLTNYDVQLGASYSTSQLASKKVTEAKVPIQEWINAKDPDEVIIGSSTTMLLRILSLCISEKWQNDDEVIITNTDHEANMAPWRDLKKNGIKVKIWKANNNTYKLESDDLISLMTKKTKLVAMTHASNILGSINPIKDIAKIVHSNNALICVDGVAFAPHRLIDVQDLNVDFYVFSTYKTFGPHQAIMYGKLDLLQSMNGINHPFIETVPYKFQPGNFNYELSYSLSAIPEYIKSVSANDSEKSLKSGFDAIANYEQSLTELLLDYLNSNPEIQIIGEKTANKNLRVSTISFVHENLNSDQIVSHIDKFSIGIRFGDFYAVELIDDLGLRNKNGVVRVSLVHYNTRQEVESLIEAFKSIL